jgi:hypothetical protein
VKQLAMLRINPPAGALMLSEYVDLKPGDWVVQNAANSGVGRAVIAIGKERGIQTINLVRRDDVIPEVVAAGGDVVLKDDDDAVSRIAGTVGINRLAWRWTAWAAPQPRGWQKRCHSMVISLVTPSWVVTTRPATSGR